MPDTQATKLEVLNQRVIIMEHQNATDHAQIIKRLDDLCLKIDTKYVTRTEHNDLEDKVLSISKGLFMVISTIIIAVLGAVLKLIFIN